MENQPTTPNTPPPAAPPASPTPPKPAAIDQGGINLLPEIAENEIKAGVYNRKANKVALGVIAVVGVIVLILILIHGYLFVRANLIKSARAAAEQTIRDNAQIEIKALATKEKLDKIYKLLTTSLPTSSLVNQVDQAAATNPAIVVTGVSISSNGEAFIDGSASSSDVLKQWVTNLTSDAQKDYFDKINLASLSGNPSEGYKFSVKLSFLKKGVYKGS